MLLLFFLACVVPTQSTGDDTNKHSGSIDDAVVEPA